MKAFTIFSTFTSLAAAICHHGTTLSPRTSEVKRAEGVFGYHELNGALNWHGLSAANKVCAAGKNQSPINVRAGSTSAVRGNTFNLNIPAQRTGAEFENLGTTVQAYAGGSMAIGRKTYNLRQFHFHTPSEHHMDDEHFPMEVHFVFQASDNTLAVIGFFIEIASGDTTNPLLEAALSRVSTIASSGQKTTTPALDYTSIKKHLSSSSVYRYAGSLTTPPCDQGVTFNVVANPLYISAATYRAVKDVVKFNSRYTQNNPGAINLLDNARNVLNTF